MKRTYIKPGIWQLDDGKKSAGSAVSVEVLKRLGKKLGRGEEKKI